MYFIEDTEKDSTWRNIQANYCTHILKSFNQNTLSSHILLVEETGVPREKYRPATNHWESISHNIVSSTPCHKPDSKSQR
jgi:hypothetical protein